MYIKLARDESGGGEVAIGAIAFPEHSRFPSVTRVRKVRVWVCILQAGKGGGGGGV